jgi:hypothetical protein
MVSLIKRSVPGAGFPAPPALLLPLLLPPLLLLVLSAGFGVPALGFGWCCLGGGALMSCQGLGVVALLVPPPPMPMNPISMLWRRGQGKVQKVVWWCECIAMWC